MSFKPVIYKVMSSDNKTYRVINVNKVRLFDSPVLYNVVKDIWSVGLTYDDDKRVHITFDTETKANMFFHKLCDTVHMPIKEMQPWLNDVKADRVKEDV
mgnify:CR=1 FL=1